MAYVNCLTLRGIKGSALTHGELDNNFLCLDTAISSLNNYVSTNFLPLSGGSITGPLSACTGGVYVNDLFACDNNEINVNANVIINGNMTVWGTATTLNTQVINSQANILTLNASGNTATAQGGGIILEDALGPGSSASILFSGGCWHIEPAVCDLVISGDTNIWGDLYLNGNLISVGGTSGYQNIIVSAYTADNYSAVSDPYITGYSASYVYITTFDTPNITSATTIDINGIGVLDIVKVGEDGLVPLEEGDILTGVTYYLIYNGENMQLLTSEPVNNPVTYTTYLGPTTAAVGGQPVGTTFSAATIQQVFDSIFYTYQSSTFTSFYIQQLGVTAPTYEVGYSITGGNYTFLWGTSFPANVKPNSIIIKNNVNATISTPVTGMSNDYSEVITLPTITNSGAGTYTWKISGTRTNNTAITPNPRTYTATWRYRRYWGNSTDPIPTSGMVTTLAYQDINGHSKYYNPSSATSAFPFSGAPGTYKYICYPSTAPDVVLIQDQLTLLNMAMADPTDGFLTPTPNNNWYYYSLPIVNQYGITNTYKCFRSKYQLGAAINIRVT